MRHTPQRSPCSCPRSPASHRALGADRIRPLAFSKQATATHNAERNMIAQAAAVRCRALESPARLCRHEASRGSKKNSDCGNNWWVSNLEFLTRVQEPRLAAPPPGPLQPGVPTQAASVPSALGPFLCLRNHDGKGVQLVNEGHPALGGAGMKRSPTGGGTQRGQSGPLTVVQFECGGDDVR
jgi:hypothetical protein